MVGLFEGRKRGRLRFDSSSSSKVEIFIINNMMRVGEGRREESRRRSRRCGRFGEVLRDHF